MMMHSEHISYNIIRFGFRRDSKIIRRFVVVSSNIILTIRRLTEKRKNVNENVLTRLTRLYTYIPILYDIILSCHFVAR